MVNEYSDWLGKTEHREDFLTRQQADGLMALLDLESDAALPLGLHWLVCVDRVRQSGLGPDGHPKKGDFLPPVSLPRRMWAQGVIEFHSPARVHQSVTRDSRISDIQQKTGRSGELVFVRVDHDYRIDGDPWLSEQHTIVYREASDGPYQQATGFTPVDPSLWPVKSSVATDEVQLFRYSALTFNGHRIHYDQPYVTGVEGYPGLIVHGPLMATWLMNFAADQLCSNDLKKLDFRVLAPVFSGETIQLLGRPTEEGFEVAVIRENGEQAIRATATC